MFAKKHLILLVAVLLVSLALAACSGDTETVKETVEVEVTRVVEKEGETVVETKIVEVTSEPEMPSGGGGDLVVAHNGSSEPALLDAQIDPYAETGLIDSFMTDGLVCRDPETMEIKPWLATSWETTDDGLTWTFHLRDDVTFHDGTHFDAEAAKYNFDRILAPETMSVEAAARLGPIVSIEVVDEYTIAFTHSEPYASFLDSFSGLMEPMWSPTALEKYGYEEFPQHLTGTGPFIFKENVVKDHVTMVRNPDYNWAPDCVDHTGPAHLDSFTFKWVSEDAVRGGIVRTGEAHISDLPAQSVVDYVDDPDYELVIGYQPGTGLQWVMNIAKAPLDDVLVRQAILHTVDRDVMNDLLYDGRYLPSYGPMIPGTTCYWDGAETQYPNDLAKAGELLDEAGWVMNESTGIREKDGQPLDVRWTALHHGEIGEVLKAQLAEVGINIVVEVVAGPVQIDMATNRDFNLMYERQRGTDPVFMDLVWNSKNSGEGGWAWTGFKDDRLDEVLDQSQVETDFDARCELLVEAQQIIMDNALTLGLFGQPRFWVVDKSVEGFDLGPSAWIYYPYMLRINE